MVVWFTGLSGSGKTTIARALERRLFEAGVQTMLLDGDQLRHGLNGDLGFSPADRRENIRRVGEVARLFFDQGSVVLCSFVSPYAADRDAARRLLPEGRFIEVHVTCDEAVLRRRDTKGLYAAARDGQEKQLTGVSAPYEAPVAPALVLDTAAGDVDACVARVHEHLLGSMAAMRAEGAAGGDE
jgi:bifunctional enzyme CysN/CysC